MRAEIIAVGSELLTPYRLDTNSLFLTSQTLNQLGIRVVHKAVVGDAPDEMRSSFGHALDRAELIVSSGGLGPTTMTARAKPSPNCSGASCTRTRAFSSTSRSGFSDSGPAA